MLKKLAKLSLLIALLLALTLPLLPSQQVSATTTLDVQVSASTDDCSKFYTGSAWALDLTRTLQRVGYAGATSYAWGGGLRFLNITIPSGTIITNAYITLNCSSSASGTTVNSKVYGELSPNPVTFANLTEFEARVHTGNSTTWNGISGWTLNNLYNSPNISVVIQEIIDQVSWSSGNPLVIFWEDFDASSSSWRNGYSYDGNTAGSPRLHIEYTAVNPPTVDNDGGASSVTINSARLNGNLTDDGGEPPNVFVYWGLTDGVDNKTAWDNEDDLGVLAVGTFYTNIGSLASDTTYFYRCYANNTGGEDWADSTENFTTLIAPPSNLVAIVLATDNLSAAWVEVGLTWTPGASLTVITRRFDSFPISPTDGVLVYNGSASAVNETITAANIETIYYTAWSQGGAGYSTPVNYLLEVESAMINIFLLLGMLGLSFGLSGFGYYFRKSPILIVACLLWVASGAWAFTQSAELWDAYFFLGCVGILMGIVSGFAPYLWLQRVENKRMTDEEWDDRMRADMEKARARYPRRTRR